MRMVFKQALAAALIGSTAIMPLSAATTSPGVRTATMAKPTETMTLSIGSGQMVMLPQPMSDIFVAAENVADVQVRSQNQLYIFGKGAGETAVYATDKAGRVVWSSTVRVGANITSVGTMLKLAMPESAITATTMNGIVLLTGTVAAPTDIEEAEKLVQKFVGDTTQVVNRLKSATPLQVTLRVKIAEVNREISKSIGMNLLSRDTSGGLLFGVAQGSPGTIANYTDPVTGIVDPTRAAIEFAKGATGTTLGFARKAFGLDLLATLDLAEADGLVTTLAEPNLTTMSGETASFLAGGEIPIPLSSGLGAVSVEFKQYGVSLSFTPDGAGRRPHLAQGSPRSVADQFGRGGSRRQYFDPQHHHPPCGNDGRTGIGPGLHDRWPAVEHAEQFRRQGALPGRPADSRRALPVEQLQAQRNRADDRRHTLSRPPRIGASGGAAQ